MQEEPDEESQCLSDDTDTEISTQVCISMPVQRFYICWIKSQRNTLDFVSASFLRTHGSAPSAGNTTHRCSATAFAVGLSEKTGTKTFPGWLTLSLSPTSQPVAFSLPTTKKTTATPASTSQTAAERCLTPSSCPPTPQLTDPFPQQVWAKARGRCLLASTGRLSSQRGKARKAWAWRSRMFGRRRCGSPASCVECVLVTETLSTGERLTCSLVSHVHGGCISFRLLVQGVGRLFRMLLRYLSSKEHMKGSVGVRDLNRNTTHR